MFKFLQIYRLQFFVLKAVFIFIVFSQPVFSQDSFKGYILDAENHKGIENVKIAFKDTSLYAFTNSEGYFKFENIEPAKYILEVSHKMYETENFNINIFSLTDSYTFYLFKKSFQTPIIIVTDEYETKSYKDLMEQSNVLQGKELQRNLSFTLASTLKDELGLSIRSMGPAPSRPVYRGLTGDRILISEDGNKTNDISATSPDHSVTIESFTTDRIEVLRGPRILMQTPTTIGGIINVIKNDIPLGMNKKITGMGGIYGETSNKGYLGAIKTQIPFNPFMFSFELSGRKASDMHTPAGILKNTELSNFNLSAGTSFIKENRIIGVSFRQYSSDYGIPGGFIGAHPDGVNINLKRNHISLKYQENELGSLIKQINFDFNKSYFYQAEFERANLIGAEFEISDYDGKLDFSHAKINFLQNGAFGTSFEYRDFKIGGYVFTPFTKSYKQALYLYENLTHKDFIFEFGARYEYNNLKPYDYRFFGEKVSSRIFNIYSLSLSGIYELYPDLFISANISRSSRVPTIEELYSQGPHLAAYSYEIGNSSLEDERGLCSELSLYYRDLKIYAMITGFRNDFSYYITSQNTGDTNYATLLPIYSTIGKPALLYGVEAQFNLSLFWNLEFKSSLSYTYGEFKNTLTPLPNIPPLKSNIGLIYNNDNFQFGVNSEIAINQDRVDEFEQPTSGYTIWNSFAQLSLVTGRVVNNISVSIDNIFNTEYYNHLSRIKSVMPESGRNFRLTYKAFF